MLSVHWYKRIGFECNIKAFIETPFNVSYSQWLPSFQSNFSNRKCFKTIKQGFQIKQWIYCFRIMQILLAIGTKLSDFLYIRICAYTIQKFWLTRWDQFKTSVALLFRRNFLFFLLAVDNRRYNSIEVFSFIDKFQCLWIYFVW